MGRLILRRAKALSALALFAVWTALLFKYFSYSPVDRLAILALLLYWLMPILLGAAGLAFVVGRPIWALLKQEVQRLWPGILVAGLLTVIFFSLIPPRMRVQLDETFLVSTSRTMHLDRRALMAMDEFTNGSKPKELNWVIDKRPPLFPFLVSLVHDARGYFIANAFLVNQCVLFLLLVFTYAWLLPAYGPLAGIAGQLLALCPPMVLWSATSAGMELLSCLLFGTVIYSAIALSRRPSLAGLARLLTLGLLFSYCRYENIGFFLGILAVAIYISRSHPRWGSESLSQKLPALLALTSVLLTPLALLFAHTLLQGDYFAVASSAPLFSPGYIPQNLVSFFKTFPDARLGRPYGGAGLFGLAALWPFYRLLGHRGRSLEVIFIGGAAAASLMLTLMFFAGNAADINQIRLFLPITVLGALCPVFAWDKFPKRVSVIALVVAAAIFLGAQAPRARDAKFGPSPNTNSMMQGIDGLMSKLSHDKATMLVISDYSPYFVINDFNSVAPETFLERRTIIEEMLRTGTTTDIFLLVPPDNLVANTNSAMLFKQLLHEFSWKLLAETHGKQPIHLYHLNKL